MHKDGKVEITIISSIALPFCRPVLLCLCLCFVSLLSDPTPGSQVYSARDRQARVTLV
jgi:hypothetical protein